MAMERATRAVELRKARVFTMRENLGSMVAVGVMEHSEKDVCGVL